MATGARVCPHCGALNSADDAKCYRCERRLPGPLATGAVDLLRLSLGTEAVVTKLIALASGAIFMLSVLGKGDFPIWFTQSARVSELVRWGALFGGLAWFEPWRHLAAIFVHANALHLLFNMLWLAAFGRVAEESIGPGRFALIYVGTGLVGYIVSDLWYLLWYGASPLTLGASGAVFGVLGADAAEAWARSSPDWRARLTRAIALAVLMFLLSGLGAGIGVNNAAHFGGLFAGIAAGYAFGRERQPHRRDRLFNRLAALALLGCLASVVACNWSPAWRWLRQAEMPQELR